MFGAAEGGRGGSVPGKIFLDGRGMSKFLTGGETPPVSFHSRENPAELPSKNLSTDGKETELWELSRCSSSMPERLHKLLNNNFDNDVAHTTSMVEMLHKIA